jgi:hypothetical protein
MKKVVLFALCVIHFSICSQIDVFDYESISFGVEQKITSHSGTYLRVSDRGAGQAVISSNDNIELLSDNGSALNFYGNYHNFQDNNMQVYNLDGFIYLLSYFGNMGSNHNGELGYSLAKYVTTPSKNLNAVPNQVDYTMTSRFWNFDFVNIKASFGKKSLNAGFNLVFKNIGITGPFTWFEDKSYKYVYHNIVNSRDLRILIGPNVAYRKTIKKLSIVAIAGVNFCPNLNKSAVKINYDPFLDLNLFFGKRAGGTVGLKYELIKGGSKVDTNDGLPLSVPMVVSQLELKVGFYFRRKPFKK